MVMERAKDQKPKEEVEEKEGGKGRSRKVPVSFNDYHTLWRGIATSIVSYDKHRENDCKTSQYTLLCIAES